MSSQATTDPGGKSAAEMEREVQQSRAEVEQTLGQIQERLSPGQIFDQALTYFREGGGGQFTRNLGTSVRDNPMPIALVALGVGWMMLSGQRSSGNGGRFERRDWDDDLEDIEERYPAYGQGSELAEGPTYWGTTAEPASEGGMGERLKEAGQAVGDKLGEAGDRARELGDQARELGDRARERAQRVRRDVEDRVSGARERADEARQRAGYYGRRARQSVLQTFSEQPLVLGAIGLAVGAALGAALPPTETEDRLMGDTRDEALRRATKAGRVQVEKVRDAAGAVVGAAREEAGKQGLTPEASSRPPGSGPSGGAKGVERDETKVAGPAADTPYPADPKASLDRP